MAMRRIGKDVRRRHGAKAPGLRWGKPALRGRCGACPIQRCRAAHRAYPENRFAPSNWSLSIL